MATPSRETALARSRTDGSLDPVRSGPFLVATLLAALAPSVASAATEFDAPPEAPPPQAYRKGLVLDSSLGAHGFTGKFGAVAPPGFWLHTQLGYELFRWFMLFAEGDLYFTDTSRTQDPTKSRAFPMFGFGLGPRFTVRVTERVGLYAQGSLGAMKADVPNNAFRILGFGDAESLGLYFGGRLGVEWYQIDRHLAFGLSVGLRDATNFKRTIGDDLPLMWDGGVSLRYTF